MAHVKYDKGESGREEWNNTVTTRIGIAIWCQKLQVEEKRTHAFKESTYTSFSKDFYSEWLAVWLLGSLTSEPDLYSELTNKRLIWTK